MRLEAFPYYFSSAYSTYRPEIYFFIVSIPSLSRHMGAFLEYVAVRLLVRDGISCIVLPKR